MKSIFISSTFKDMQAERDLLHEKIFPRLRKVIAEYGEDVQELDLRWGVDTANMTEEESGRLVLKVCIDAIDRCIPFIVVLLGERYGWIPGEEIVYSVDDQRVDRHYEPGMSITNLEIQYGALKEEGLLDRCVFCMRNSDVVDMIEPEYRGIYGAESEEHQRKLDDLKQKIRQKQDAAILDYDAVWDADKHKISGLESFGEQLYEILEEMIRDEFKDYKETEWREKILLETKRTKEQYLSSYVERPVEEAGICRNLYSYYSFREADLNDIMSGIHIKGIAGTGKSALMAACADRFEKLGFPVVLYFSGNPGCQDLKVLKQIMIFELENILNIEHEETKMPLEERLSALNDMAKDRQVVCVIDALDELFEKEKEKILDVVYLCPDISFVVSSLEDFELTNPIGKDIKLWPIAIEGLANRNVEQIIERTAGRRGKKLDDVITEMIVEKESSKNPLYLSNILQRFFMMDGKEFQAAEKMGAGMDGIHRYMEKLSCEMPETQEEMVLYILEETMRRFEADTLYEIMCLIAISKFGLKESELEMLLEIEGKVFAQIEFQQMVSYLYEVFMQKEDGKWTFRHRLFREALQHQMSEEDKKHCVELLIQYAKRDETFLRDEGIYYIFEQMHPFGRNVIEDWKKYENGSLLGQLIAELVERENAYESYFLGMAREVVTDQFAQFWIEEFRTFAYSAKNEALRKQMLQQILMQGTISHQIECMCCYQLAQYYLKSNQYEKTKAYLDRMEQTIARLPEEEQAFQKASMYYAKAYYFTVGVGNVAEALHCDELALEYIEKAQSEKPTDEEILYKKIDIKNGLYYDYRDGQQVFRSDLLESALADACKYSQEIDDSRFTRVRIEMLGDLMVCFANNKNYDAERMKRYKEECLELARRWIEAFPTMENMACFVRILYQAAFTEKNENKYPHYKEAYKYCKKRYETCRTIEAKEELAKVCGYAGRAAARSGEEEAVRFLDEAIGLNSELMNEQPENVWNYLRKQDCLIEKAQYELKQAYDFQKEEYARMAGYVEPMAESLAAFDFAGNGIKKATEARYKYDVFEILTEVYEKTKEYPETEKYARQMLAAALVLKEENNTKWNQRRVFKSSAALARTFYRQGQTEAAKTALGEAIGCYWEMAEIAEEEQKDIVVPLYNMYIQTALSLGNVNEAKRALEEAESLERANAFGVVRKEILVEETKYASAEDFLRDERSILLEVDSGKYMTHRICRFLLSNDELNECAEKFLGQLLSDMAYYKALDGYPELQEDEIAVFKKYIAPIYNERGNDLYWKYLEQYVANVETGLCLENLIYIAGKHFCKGCFEKARQYLQRADGLNALDELYGAGRLMALLCEAVEAKDCGSIVQVKELFKRAESQEAFQTLCQKEEKELSVQEKVMCLIYHELEMDITEGPEKTKHFLEVVHLAVGNVGSKDELRNLILDRNLFQRADIEAIICSLEAEELREAEDAMGEMIQRIESVEERIRVFRLFAGKFAESEKCEGAAWRYYEKAVQTSWRNPEEMSTEELAERLKAQEGRKAVMLMYNRKMLKEVLAVTYAYYCRTQDEQIVKKAVRDKIEIVSGLMDKGDQLALEEEMLAFFRKLIISEGDRWMRECIEYLSADEHLKHNRITNLIALKKDIKDRVSADLMEVFYELLDKKGRADIQNVEEKLRNQIRSVCR